MSDTVAAERRTPPPTHSGAWSRACDRMAIVLNDDVLALIARVAIAAIFRMSGRTKVDGWLRVSAGTCQPFADEFRVPLLPLPVLGLMTRASTLALPGMTAVIQVFVYPDAWPTHLSWAGLPAPMVARGATAKPIVGTAVHRTPSPSSSAIFVSHGPAAAATAAVARTRR